jgi:hypothetical protein
MASSLAAEVSAPVRHLGDLASAAASTWTRALAQPPSFRKLAGDVGRFDVAVIGGGIVGVTTGAGTWAC